MIFFASASANQNDLVEKEARAVGAQDIQISSGGIQFSADLETAYRFAIWTRCATRLLVLVHRFDNLDSTDALYEHSLSLPWERWINPDTTFAITETVSNCRWIRNSHFASLRLKDAIVERVRTKFNDRRPNVDRQNPDIVFHLHVNKDLVSWYVDFGGRDLSRRSYRKEQTQAVMGEFMAASLLYRSDWYRHLCAFQKGEESTAPILLDPFCGSGTICIEAALMATNTAPGLLKTENFAFLRLPIHNDDLWQKVVDQAQEQICENHCKIIGWDIDSKAIEISKANAQSAGVGKLITFSVKDFTTCTEQDIQDITQDTFPISEQLQASNTQTTAQQNASATPSACVVTDPPYGVRLDSGSAAIMRLYSAMGKNFYNLFYGWDISILCGNSELLSFIDMKPNRTNTLINGGIECQVAHYHVFSRAERQQLIDRALAKRQERLSTPLSPGAQMIANRLTKNLASIGKQMAQDGVTCYRLYDADMPEYNAAIDIYENKWISLQEYAAPASISTADTQRRLNELILATERVTGIDIDNIFLKTRDRQRGSSQYTKKASSSHFLIVNENNHRFFVNFTDYLDTGLFLDHRPVRKMIEDLSQGKRFLNLFCYTASATVYAASGGALSTVSVDANSNYLDWAMQNMRLNNLDTMNHFFYRDDCLAFMRDNRDVFDLIFCDPPTFSNSKNRDTIFDVQRDHGYLIRSCMRHLSSNGTLIFSTNFTRFKMFSELYDEFLIEDITAQTIGADFSRNPKIHRCYKIQHRFEHPIVLTPPRRPIKKIIKKA